MQYWTPASGHHIDMDTYIGWDTKEGNLWCEDRSFQPNWSQTDCIMTAWKLRIRAGTVDPKIRIPKVQMNIIKGSVDVYDCE